MVPALAPVPTCTEAVAEFGQGGVAPLKGAETAPRTGAEDQAGVQTNETGGSAWLGAGAASAPTAPNSDRRSQREGMESERPFGR